MNEENIYSNCDNCHIVGIYIFLQQLWCKCWYQLFRPKLWNKQIRESFQTKRNERQLCDSQFLDVGRCGSSHQKHSLRQIFQIHRKNLSFISVNFDDSDNMFKELVRTDGLSEVSQFYEKDGMESEVYKRYRLKSGMNSYLLDKDGKILAINPTQQQLTKYFCQ